MIGIHPHSTSVWIFLGITWSGIKLRIQGLGEEPENDIKNLGLNLNYFGLETLIGFTEKKGCVKLKLGLILEICNAVSWFGGTELHENLIMQQYVCCSYHPSWF